MTLSSLCSWFSSLPPPCIVIVPPTPSSLIKVVSAKLPSPPPSKSIDHLATILAVCISSEQRCSSPSSSSSSPLRNDSFRKLSLLLNRTPNIKLAFSLTNHPFFAFTINLVNALYASMFDNVTVLLISGKKYSLETFAS